MTDSTEQKKEAWTPPPFGSPCWVETPAIDVQGLKKFYAGLFPTWTWTPATEAYPDEKIAMYQYGGKSGLHGGLVRVPEQCKAAGSESQRGVGATVYHFVDSIEDTKKRIEELGGKAVGGKEREGENGWYMYCHDIEGNRFGIYEVDPPKPKE